MVNVNDKTLPRFKVIIDYERCIRCGRCVKNCTYGAIVFDKKKETVGKDGNEKKKGKDKKEKPEPVVKNTGNCVACQRCVTFCPKDAIEIVPYPVAFSPHATWTPYHLRSIMEQARTGNVLLAGNGNDRPYPMVFDYLVWDACQVTNPSIDALREPIETRTYIGRKPKNLAVVEKGGKFELDEMAPNIATSMPLIIGHMSLGSLSYNAITSMYRAVKEVDTMMGTGEGGLHKDHYQYKDHLIGEIASGRFGIDTDYLGLSAIEIKIGQGAKPGHGGQLPGEKVTELISETRMIPLGTDALSPNPQHDIYSIEDLKTLIAALHEATEYRVPIGVKIAAVNNVAAIASGIVRANADFMTIDGFRGGTGAAPRVVRDNAGIPIELAIASVDQHLRDERIRHKVTIIAGGGLRSSADLIKIIALGADVGMVGTAPLIALGCKVCQQCPTGKCSWGIATGSPELGNRIDVDWGTRRVANMLRAWNADLEEVLGTMGIDAVESFVGNRDRLRYIGPNPVEGEILGVKHAGERIGRGGE